MSDIYPTGQMDPFIRTALDRAADRARDLPPRRQRPAPRPLAAARRRLPQLRQGRHDDRVGLGRRDGRGRVPPRPRRRGPTGCGWTGRVSPFGGNAKLPWNLEWAAQWSLFGVTIEPNGKDLATAGGSRDRSDAIAREVFEREPPLNFPYEFLNIGGQEDVDVQGAWAPPPTRFTEIVPPEQTRFLFVRPRPESAIEFDPEGTDAVPRLFDEFDRLGAATAGREVKGELPSGFDSIFRYSLLDPAADVERGRGRVPAGLRPPRAARPGPGRGRRTPASRPRRARRSPTTEAAEFEVRLGRRPPLARGVRARARADRDPARRAAGRGRPAAPRAARVPARARRAPPTATRRRPASSGRRRSSPSPPDHGLDAKAAFNALYLAFLGRPNGPRAGWLLASLERDFVIRRLTRGRRAHRGGDGMSVGVQRLREEPDRIRQGAIDKREDPALVDRAIEVDARRRRLQAESDTLKAERNAASKQIGEAIRGGAKPDGPEVARAARRVHAAPASGSTRSTPSWRRPRPSSRTCCSASRTPPTPRSRSAARRPTSRSAPGASAAAREVDGGRRRDLEPPAALGDRRGAGHHRQRPRRQDRGLRASRSTRARARGSSAA